MCTSQLGSSEASYPLPVFLSSEGLGFTHGAKLRGASSDSFLHLFDSLGEDSYLGNRGLFPAISARSSSSASKGFFYRWPIASPNIIDPPIHPCIRTLERGNAKFPSTETPLITSNACDRPLRAFVPCTYLFCASEQMIG